MSNRNLRTGKMLVLAMLLAVAAPAWAQDADRPSTADHPMHGESAAQHAESAPQAPEFEPAIPEGMTLEEVFDFAASPPPSDFPEAVPNDMLFAFMLVEQLEYRVADDATDDHLGWEVQGWFGGDFNKLWWKNEGEAVFAGANKGDMATDLLYSRLITPFWDIQVGMQYANAWGEGDNEDRWSGVIALRAWHPTSSSLITRSISPRTVMAPSSSKPSTTSASPSASCFSRGLRFLT